MAKIKYTSISWLKSNEKLAINETIAMMSYNPSIGRALSSGGVIKFKKIAIRKIRHLKNIKNKQQFDRFHDRFVLDIIKAIKKTSSGKKISYGLGQKPINVFLKVYIDWASYPNRQVSRRLNKFLHVPLDHWVMWYIKNERPKVFDRFIRPIYLKREANISNLSLVQIDKKIYYAWQEACREIYSFKPLLLDVIWARAPRGDDRKRVVARGADF